MDDHTRPRSETEASQRSREGCNSARPQAPDAAANPGSVVVGSSPFPRVFTVTEAAAMLKLSVRSIRRLIGDGKLDVTRIGRAIRIREEILRALIEGK
jgi:excisionase family DNA binding protein